MSVTQALQSPMSSSASMGFKTGGTLHIPSHSTPHYSPYTTPHSTSHSTLHYSLYTTLIYYHSSLHGVQNRRYTPHPIPHYTIHYTPLHTPHRTIHHTSSWSLLPLSPSWYTHTILIDSFSSHHIHLTLITYPLALLLYTPTPPHPHPLTLLPFSTSIPPGSAAQSSAMLSSFLTSAQSRATTLMAKAASFFTKFAPMYVSRVVDSLSEGRSVVAFSLLLSPTINTLSCPTPIHHYHHYHSQEELAPRTSRSASSTPAPPKVTDPPCLIA